MWQEMWGQVLYFTRSDLPLVENRDLTPTVAVRRVPRPWPSGAFALHLLVDLPLGGEPVFQCLPVLAAPRLVYLVRAPGDPVHPRFRRLRPRIRGTDAIVHASPSLGESVGSLPNAPATFAAAGIDRSG